MSETAYILHRPPPDWDPPFHKAYVSVAYKLPGAVEEVLLKDLGEDLFRIVCVPFWTNGLAYLDVVALDPAGGPIHVHERSGHRVLRALFRPKEAAELAGLIESLMAVSHRCDIRHEHSSDQYVVFDIAPGADPQDLMGRLERLEALEHLIWEWGD